MATPKIILKAHKIPTEPPLTNIRIKAEAGEVLRQLMRETGLSCCYIASQIILQASDYIEYEEVQ